jgi:hypothetical protein
MGFLKKWLMAKISKSKMKFLFILLSLISFNSCGNEEEAPILVGSIEINGEYINNGLSSQLMAVILPENTTNQEVTWSVSNEQIATVSSTGLLTAVANGTVTVSAVAKDGSGVTGTRLFGVSGHIVDVESVQINGQNVTDGLPTQYSVTITPSNASYSEIEWSVSDSNIAFINNEGILTPLNNGTVKIKATMKQDISIFAELQVVISGYILDSDVLAFPGAEGFGREATGGRGGRVIFVTNLTDDGIGSFRHAIEQSGARYVLFKVSGTIQLTRSLNIRNGNITIAGQTAPGDGVTVRDYPVIVDSDNVIIRFMRFRMGDAAKQEGDALGGRFHKNIIVDHCSMSWSTDECVSFYGNENTTIQWCYITESLRNSVHDKGAHGYGGIWGGKRASFHHNLLAHHDSRNPRLGEPAGDAFALTDLVDLRNNVIYNWGGNSCYGGEAMNVNIVNCYYKPGPRTSKLSRIISIDKNKNVGTDVYDIWGKFSIDGNYMAGSTSATNDNWTNGVYNQFHSSYGTISAADKEAMRLSTPHEIEDNVTTHSAQDAYSKVLAYGGASFVKDAIDVRITTEVSNGTFTYSGSNGSANGIIDSQSDVGGWPTLNSTTPPVDTSEDGMPDNWKTTKGLDRLIDETNGHDLHAGYENVEVYLNSLVELITSNQK